MASLDEMQQRVADLTKRHREASDRKNKLQGQLEAKRTELHKLVEEIRKAGFDPKTLKAEKERLEKELDELMKTFDFKLTKVEAALDEYES